MGFFRSFQGGSKKPPNPILGWKPRSHVTRRRRARSSRYVNNVTAPQSHKNVIIAATSLIAAASAAPA